MFGPPFKIERNERNLGYAGNCNQAAQRAIGDYLLFLNQDCRAVRRGGDAEIVGQLLQPGWADKMAAHLAMPEVGLVGPKLLFPNGAIQSCGGLFDAGHGPYHRYLGWANPLDRHVNTTERVKWLTGACFMIARADYEALGGLDVGYRVGYFEDVDISMRVAYELGKQIWYCAEACLVHEVGSTGGVPPEIFKANSTRFHMKWDRLIEPDTHHIMVPY